MTADLGFALINRRNQDVLAIFKSRNLARLSIQSCIHLNPALKDCLMVEPVPGLWAKASGLGATATTPPHRVEAAISPPEMAKPPSR
ncbi:MAG: hypothetical protein AAGH78_00685 [Cyanobacteria bacterium P01_H01_bin.58]